jgi:hypothetical protein
MNFDTKDKMSTVLVTNEDQSWSVEVDPSDPVFSPLFPSEECGPIPSPLILTGTLSEAISGEWGRVQDLMRYLRCDLFFKLYRSCKPLTLNDIKWTKEQAEIVGSDEVPIMQYSEVRHCSRLLNLPLGWELHVLVDGMCTREERVNHYIQQGRVLCHQGSNRDYLDYNILAKVSGSPVTDWNREASCLLERLGGDYLYYFLGFEHSILLTRLLHSSLDWYEYGEWDIAIDKLADVAERSGNTELTRWLRLHAVVDASYWDSEQSDSPYNNLYPLTNSVHVILDNLDPSTLDQHDPYHSSTDEHGAPLDSSTGYPNQNRCRATTEVPVHCVERYLKRMGRLDGAQILQEYESALVSKSPLPRQLHLASKVCARDRIEQITSPLPEYYLREDLDTMLEVYGIELTSSILRILEKLVQEGGDRESIANINTFLQYCRRSSLL